MASNWVQELVNKGLLSQEQLQEVNQLASTENCTFEQALLHLRIVTDETIGRVQAAQLDYQSIDLDRTEIFLDAVQRMPESIAREIGIYAVATEEHKLTVAMSEAMNYTTINRLRFLLNCEIVVVLASKEAILAANNRSYPPYDPEYEAWFLREFREVDLVTRYGFKSETEAASTNPQPDDQPPTMP